MKKNQPPERDFDSEEPTPTIPAETMERLMEDLRSGVVTVRSPGVPTLTSDRPTKPMRPLALRVVEKEDFDIFWDAADAEADWQAGRVMRDAEKTVRERKGKST